MGLTAKCDSCGKAYTVADDKAGKRLKCNCGGSVQVPEVAEEVEDFEEEDGFDAPPPRSPARRSRSGGDDDAVSSVIPYKNPAALFAYYLSIFSLIPCLGVLLGIPAIILGLIGLSKQRKHPEMKGSAHAIVGIVLGSLTTLAWIGSILLMVFGVIKPW